MMKKWGIVITALLCCILSTVSIWADDGKNQNPDYATDYYMIVQSPEGGINLYSEADPASNVLNDKLIVNGTAIHIEGEKTGADQKEWGYTQYHGMNGYVPMDDLDPVTRAEAVRTEYDTFSGTEVDFDVKIQTEDGNAPLYNGPGEKFEEVSGFIGVENSSTVHISQYVKGEDGINWGKTDADGTEGWINLDRDTDYQAEDAQQEKSAAKGSVADQDVAMTEGESAAAETATSEITSTAETTPKATFTKKVTPTPKATPTEKVTPTPEATPTEKTTPTPKATPTEKATPTPEATPTDEASAEDAEKEETKSETSQEQAETEKKEEAEKKDNTDRKDSDSEKSQKTSGKNVKTSSGMKNPVVWISLIGILAIVILLIYFLRKKK